MHMRLAYYLLRQGDARRRELLEHIQPASCRCCVEGAGTIVVHVTHLSPRTQQHPQQSRALRSGNVKGRAPLAVPCPHVRLGLDQRGCGGGGGGR